MYFAGPICDGLTCAPLFVIVLAGFLIPIGAGIVATWLFSKWLIRRINSKRQVPLSKRQSIVTATLLFVIVSGVALFVWWFPGSPLLKNYIYQQGIEQVSQFSIYQPSSLSPLTVKVTISKSGFRDSARYEAVSKFSLSNREVTVEENYSRSFLDEDLSKYEQDERYSCKSLNTEISYCKARFNNRYYVDVRDKRLKVSTEDSDTGRIEDFLISFRLKEIGTIKNVEYLKRSY